MLGGDAATMEGCQELPEAGRGVDSSIEPTEDVSLCGHLDFRLTTSRTVRKHNCVL